MWVCVFGRALSRISNVAPRLCLLPCMCLSLYMHPRSPPCAHAVAATLPPARTLVPCTCPAPAPPRFRLVSAPPLFRSCPVPLTFNHPSSHHTPCCPAAVPFPFPPFLAPFPFPITTHLIHTHTLERYLRPLTASEKLVGFYSTGPKIRGADLLVDELFRRYHANPVFVIIDVRADVEGMPVQAYHSVEEVRENGKETVREFKHITSEIGAYEAEEVGVETLLRDINDPSVSSLAAQVRHKISSLKGLAQRLEEIQVREK